MSAAPEPHSGAQPDVAAQVRAMIDEMTPAGAYGSRDVARSVVARLQTYAPSLLDEFLYGQAETIIWQMINDRDRSMRARARTAGPRSVFANAAESYVEGDSTALAEWLNVPFVVEGGNRKRLRDMTSDDLCYVADDYRARAKSLAFEAAFLRAIAKKVGNGATVGDRLTDEQLHGIRANLTVH